MLSSNKYFKRLLVLTLALFVCPVNTWAQKVTKENLISEGKKRTFYLFLPDTVKPESPAPLVVLLHGSNHIGTSLTEKWKDLAVKEGFVIAAPDSIDSAVWGIPADGPLFMHDLVEALKTKYPIDARRVYLFGHSGGAGFALLMALYESQYFAAVAVHAGALNANGISAIKTAKRKTPIHIQVGNKDPLFPLLVVRETRDALKDAGFPVELQEIPNHDHWYYDLAPRINQAAWDFLKTYSLSDEPLFENHNFGSPGKSVKSINAFAEHYNKGLERLQQRDYAGAILAFNKALAFDDQSSDLYNNRGVAYAAQKDLEAAVADFSRSISIKPTEAALGNRGGVYFELKRIEEAVADFSAAVKLNPSAQSYSNRGLILAQTGKPEAALADYNRAIEVDPKFGRGYVLRGLLALNQGQADAAQKDFDTGFRLDPGLHAEFDSLISQIKAIRGIR